MTVFKRNETGRLQFDRLEFECMIADLLDQTPPKDMKDLRWMVKVMCDSLQLVAWEYSNDEFDGEEWEDVFYPADAF
jgi:hypothetical protein